MVTDLLAVAELPRGRMLAAAAARAQVRFRATPGGPLETGELRFWPLPKGKRATPLVGRGTQRNSGRATVVLHTRHYRVPVEDVVFLFAEGEA